MNNSMFTSIFCSDTERQTDGKGQSQHHNKEPASGRERHTKSANRAVIEQIEQRDEERSPVLSVCTDHAVKVGTLSSIGLVQTETTDHGSC